MLTPQDLPEAFELDGSFRDLYVLDTTVDDWKALFNLLRSRRAFSHQLFINGEPAAIPQNPDPGFPDSPSLQSGNVGWSLSIDLDGLQLAAHFFSPEQIEFNLDPKQLNAETFVELLNFMASLGRALKREVLLTPENREHAPIAKYDPRQDSITKVPATQQN